MQNFNCPGVFEARLAWTLLAFLACTQASAPPMTPTGQSEEALTVAQPGFWKEVAAPANLVSLSVADATHAVAVDNGGGLWRLSGDTWTQDPIASVLQATTSLDGSTWIAQDGGVVQRNVRGAGALYHSYNPLLNETVRANLDAQWAVISGSMAQIAGVSSSTAWGVDSSGGVTQWHHNVWSPRAGLAAASLSAAHDGTVWALDQTGQAFSWNGTVWVPVTATMHQVAVGSATNIWGLTDDGHVWHWNGTSFELRSAPTGSWVAASTSETWLLDSSGHVQRWRPYCVAGQDHTTGICECESGYALDGSCGANPCDLCGADEQCLVSGTSASCVPRCSAGQAWNGQSCDTDRCAVNNGGCPAVGTKCVNTPGAVRCEAQCPSGYTGTYPNCVDIDECAVNNGGCDVNRPCFNLPGSMQCGDCAPGFRYEDQRATGPGTCLRIDTCTENCPPNNPCDDYGDGEAECHIDKSLATVDGCPHGYRKPRPPAFLHDQAQGYECVCEAGYRKVNGICTDYDGCAENNGGCLPLGIATCSDTGGERTCGCPEGYWLPPPHVWTTWNPATVEPGQNDYDLRHGNRCCPRGYALGEDGECVPPPAELQRARPWDPMYVTLGHGDGLCPPGFYSDSWNPWNADHQGMGHCVDLNECALNNGGCPADVICKNYAGGFTCGGACPEGYTDTGTECIDIDECQIPPVVTEWCENYPGGALNYDHCPMGRLDDFPSCTPPSTCPDPYTCGTFQDCELRWPSDHSEESMFCGPCKFGTVPDPMTGLCMIPSLCGYGEVADPMKNCYETYNGTAYSNSCPFGFSDSLQGDCRDFDQCDNGNPCYSGPWDVGRCHDIVGGAFCGPCAKGRHISMANPGVTLCLLDNQCDLGACGPNPCAKYAANENYTCTCPAGSAPLSSDWYLQRFCSDVNECATNNGGCPTGSTCLNVADGRICTTTSTCRVPTVCPPSATNCIIANAPDSSACDDGDPNTVGDACHAGACVGVTCIASDQCHDVGTWDPSTHACTNPRKADATPCDDGDACTTTDACTAGVCQGVTVTCSGTDACHPGGTCDPATGQCSQPLAEPGTGCPDGVDSLGSCTAGGLCVGPSSAWTVRVGSNGTDQLSAVAMDSAGNVVGAGFAAGAVDGQSYAGSQDAVLLKYSSAGTRLWTRELGTSSTDSAAGVAIGSGDSVYVTGMMRGPIDGQSSAGLQDVWLSKYDAAGNKLWTRLFGTSVGDFGNAVVVGGGGVYVAGYTQSNLSGSVRGGKNDYLLAKYDENGDALWMKSAGTSEDDVAQGVTVDPSGNIYVAGTTGAAFPSTSWSGGKDIFVARYDPSGTRLWIRELGTASDDSATGIVFGGDGALYVSGITAGDLGGRAQGSTDAVLLKLDTSGNLLWSRQLGSPALDEGLAIAADTSAVYVTGRSLGQLPGANVAGTLNLFAAKYDFAGALQTVREYTGGNNSGTNLGTSIAARGGRLVVAGATSATTFDGVASLGGTDGLLLSLCSNQGFTCQLAGSCSTNNGGCSRTQTCTSAGAGAVLCGCASGYTGSTTCSDVNECLVNNGGCDPLSTCTNTVGGRTCSACPAGYTGTGSTRCVLNSDPCASHPCDPLTTCTANGSAYTCSACPAGYSGTGVTSCVDIDECQTNNGGCAAYQACTNLVGGRTCSCPLGRIDTGSACVVPAPAWTTRVGTTGTDQVNATAIESTGNVVVAGFVTGNVDDQTSVGGQDAFLSRYSPTGAKQWTREIGTSQGDGANGVAIGADDSVYVAGFMKGSIDGQTAPGGTDLWLAKYDVSGNRLWSRLLGTAANDSANAVAVRSGAVYVAGIAGSAFPGSTNGGRNDIALARYDENGTLSWVRSFGSSLDDSAAGVAVDAQGNVYVSGTTGGALPGSGTAGGKDIFLAKYDAAGSRVWLKQLGTASDDFGTGVAIGADGGIYVSGTTGGALTGASAGSTDAVLLKFDSTGALVWTRQLGGLALDEGLAVATDESAVYLTGRSLGQLPGANAGGTLNLFAAKYDLSGNLQIVREYSGGNSSGTTFGASVAAARGRLIVGGATSATAFDGVRALGGTDGLVLSLCSGHDFACELEGSCSSNHGGCTASQICAPGTSGHVLCGCGAGYTGSLVCSDVNECLVNNGGCGDPAVETCTNTVGSRACSP